MYILPKELLIDITTWQDDKTISKPPLNKEVTNGQAVMWHCKKCGLLNIYWRDKCYACNTPAAEL